jgi:hypothetical protein
LFVYKTLWIVYDMYADSLNDLLKLSRITEKGAII